MDSIIVSAFTLDEGQPLEACLTIRRLAKEVKAFLEIDIEPLTGTGLTWAFTAKAKDKEALLNAKLFLLVDGEAAKVGFKLVEEPSSSRSAPAPAPQASAVKEDVPTRQPYPYRGINDFPTPMQGRGTPPSEPAALSPRGGVSPRAIATPAPAPAATTTATLAPASTSSSGGSFSSSSSSSTALKVDAEAYTPSAPLSEALVEELAQATISALSAQAAAASAAPMPPAPLPLPLPAQRYAFSLPSSVPLPLPIVPAPVSGPSLPLPLPLPPQGSFPPWPGAPASAASSAAVGASPRGVSSGSGNGSSPFFRGSDTAADAMAVASPAFHNVPKKVLVANCKRPLSAQEIFSFAANAGTRIFKLSFLPAFTSGKLTTKARVVVDSTVHGGGRLEGAVKNLLDLPQSSSLVTFTAEPYDNYLASLPSIHTSSFDVLLPHQLPSLPPAAVPMPAAAMTAAAAAAMPAYAFSPSLAPPPSNWAAPPVSAMAATTTMTTAYRAVGASEAPDTLSSSSPSSSSSSAAPAQRAVVGKFVIKNLRAKFIRGNVDGVWNTFATRLRTVHPSFSIMVEDKSEFASDGGYYPALALLTSWPAVSGDVRIRAAEEVQACLKTILITEPPIVLSGVSEQALASDHRLRELCGERGVLCHVHGHGEVPVPVPVAAAAAGAPSSAAPAASTAAAVAAGDFRAVAEAAIDNSGEKTAVSLVYLEGNKQGADALRSYLMSVASPSWSFRLSELMTMAGLKPTGPNDPKLLCFRLNAAALVARLSVPSQLAATLTTAAASSSDGLDEPKIVLRGRPALAKGVLDNLLASRLATIRTKIIELPAGRPASFFDSLQSFIETLPFASSKGPKPYLSVDRAGSRLVSAWLAINDAEASAASSAVDAFLAAAAASAPSQAAGAAGRQQAPARRLKPFALVDLPSLWLRRDGGPESKSWSPLDYQACLRMERLLAKGVEQPDGIRRVPIRPDRDLEELGAPWPSPLLAACFVSIPGLIKEVLDSLVLYKNEQMDPALPPEVTAHLSKEIRAVVKQAYGSFTAAHASLKNPQIAAKNFGPGLCRGAAKGVANLMATTKVISEALAASKASPSFAAVTASGSSQEYASTAAASSTAAHPSSSTVREKEQEREKHKEREKEKDGAVATPTGGSNKATGGLYLSPFVVPEFPRNRWFKSENAERPHYELFSCQIGLQLDKGYQQLQDGTGDGTVQLPHHRADLTLGGVDANGAPYQATLYRRDKFGKVTRNPLPLRRVEIEPEAAIVAAVAAMGEGPAAPGSDLDLSIRMATAFGAVPSFVERVFSALDTWQAKFTAVCSKLDVSFKSPLILAVKNACGAIKGSLKNPQLQNGAPSIQAGLRRGAAHSVFELARASLKFVEAMDLAPGPAPAFSSAVTAGSTSEHAHPRPHAHARAAAGAGAGAADDDDGEEEESGDDHDADDRSEEAPAATETVVAGRTAPAAPAVPASGSGSGPATLPFDSIPAPVFVWLRDETEEGRGWAPLPYQQSILLDAAFNKGLALIPLSSSRIELAKGGVTKNGIPFHATQLEGTHPPRAIMRVPVLAGPEAGDPTSSMESAVGKVPGYADRLLAAVEAYEDKLIVFPTPPPAEVLEPMQQAIEEAKACLRSTEVSKRKAAAVAIASLKIASRASWS